MQSMSFHRGHFNICVDWNVIANDSNYYVQDMNGPQEHTLITFHDAGDLFMWLHDHKYEPGFYI